MGRSSLSSLYVCCPLLSVCPASPAASAQWGKECATAIRVRGGGTEEEWRNCATRNPQYSSWNLEFYFRTTVRFSLHHVFLDGRRDCSCLRWFLVFGILLSLLLLELLEDWSVPVGVFTRFWTLRCLCIVWRRAIVRRCCGGWRFGNSFVVRHQIFNLLARISLLTCRSSRSWCRHPFLFGSIYLHSCYWVHAFLQPLLPFHSVSSLTICKK